MHAAKATIRSEIRRRLAERTERQRVDDSERIARRLLELDAWRRAGAVMAFASLPGEVLTEPILAAAWSAGKRVLLPRVDWSAGRLLAVEIRSPAEILPPGRHGLREPAGEPLTDLGQIGLVLVPGLAFDAGGGRLGRGGGYYDRFLAQPELTCPSCGLAFDCQVLADPLPRSQTDLAVDLLVSPSGVWTVSGEET